MWAMLSDTAIELVSAAALVALAAALAAWAWTSWRATHYSPGQAPWMLYGYVMARVVWRARVRGRFRLPTTQGAVIVSNHISGVDPALIALSVPRPVRWLVAREWCIHPVLRFFFRTMGCIPVNRGGVDTAATKTAIRSAADGDLVGMFPEGRINFSGDLMLPGRPGVALVALRAGVPAVPCYVRGMPIVPGRVFSTALMTGRAELRIGEPLDLSPWRGREGEDGVLEEVTLHLLRAIARLADRPDYEPRLAGKRWKPGTAPMAESAGVPR
jgi:1-acyl-sn-glycerol-3-phosphate acyltransferase